MTSVQFSALARLLSQESSRHGLASPSFKSPPARPDLMRSIRRNEGDPPVVAVRLRGRSISDVAHDVIEGILVSNELDGVAAEGWRLYLRSVVEASYAAAA